MAYEADRVVVELLAENSQFDAATKASAQNFQQAMGGIQSSGAAAEKGVSQFSSALKSNRLEMNQSRIGMMEFQHIARGVSDQFATSGLSTQLFTSHIGELSEAVVLSGGAFGKLGLFLQGPWGIAMTLAASAAIPLLMNLMGQKNALDDLYAKLVKHKEEQELNAQANDIWSHTLDGLIDRTKKLTEALDKQTQTQEALNDATQRSAQEQFAAALSAEARLTAQGASPETLKKVSGEVTAAAIALHEAQQIATEAAAKGSTDLSVAAKTWIDAQRQMMQEITGEHPELTGNEAIQQAVDLFDKAAEDAASAKMPFRAFADQVHDLDTKLLNGSITADTFAQKVRALASSLNSSTAAFKDQDGAINSFKQNVFGVEGVGANKRGSSAAGFGQFMPGTFESYFRQLYPDQAAGMTNEQIDAERSVQAVAKAVLDAATRDYVTVLKAAGQQITQASLYTVHLLGAPDAKKLFAASPNATLADVYGSRHANALVSGNPFLGSSGSTVSSAESAIATFFGHGSQSVTAGAVALNEQLQKQDDLWKKIHDDVGAGLVKQQDITEELKHQGELVPHIGTETLVDASAMAELAVVVQRVTDQINEATQMGDQFVQDVLNPANWKSFGSIAHTVLADIMKDLETIALMNPIENWLDGGHRLTFGSLFSLLGGGSKVPTLPIDAFGTGNNAGVPAFAGGGAFKVNGGTDTNLLSINGEARARVSADETIAVIPSNARAASPLAAAQSMIRLVVEASPYFDGHVAEIAGPIAVEAGKGGAYAGAGMARENLARRQLHQLGSRG